MSREIFRDNLPDYLGWTQETGQVAKWESVSVTTAVESRSNRYLSMSLDSFVGMGTTLLHMQMCAARTRVPGLVRHFPSHGVYFSWSSEEQPTYLREQFPCAIFDAL